MEFMEVDQVCLKINKRNSRNHQSNNTYNIMGAAQIIVEDYGGSMNGAWGGICVVDTNKFVAIGQVYQGSTIYTYVCTVSGNTITVTASNNLSLATRTYTWFSGCQLNTNAGVF